MQISADNGFNSLSNFNKEFKRHFDQSPSMFRQAKQHGKAQTAPAPEISVQSDVDVLERPQQQVATTHLTTRNAQINLDTSEQAHQLDLALIVNLGHIEDLFLSDISWNWQTHLEHLLSQVNFSAARILIDDAALQKKRQYIPLLVTIINYLRDERVLPWLTFEIDGRQAPTRTEKLMDDFLSQIKENIRPTELQACRFEIKIIQTSSEDFGRRLYDYMRSTIAAKIGPAKVGLWMGNAKSLQQDRVADFMQCDSFDFLTLDYLTDIDDLIENQQAFVALKAQLRNFLIACNKQFRGVPIYLAEVGLEVPQDDYLQDSLFAGAFLLSGVVDNIDLIDGAGAARGFDQPADRSRKRLGLLTAQGLERTTLSALNFVYEVNRSKLAYLKHNLMVTTTEDVYMIYNNLSLPVALNTVLDDSPETINQRFVDLPLALTANIVNIDNGDYEMRTYDCRNSLLDEWRSLGYSQELRGSDLAYLANSRLVELTLQTVHVVDKRLTITHRCPPNNFFIVHLRRKKLNTNDKVATFSL